MILTLFEKKQETPDTISFKFKADENVIWRAGQYLRYTLPQDNPDDRGENRFFTISAAPHEGFVMITTRFASDKSSTFKTTLRSMPIGGQIQAHGPSGEFIVRNLAKEYVFLAGGIGITPFRSTLKELDFQRKPINITLLYANRSENNIPFKEELEEIASRNPGLKIKYAIDPQRIDADYIQNTIPNIQAPIYYASGPKPMVEAIEKELESLGVPKEHVKQDYFPGYEA